ncbi:MAG TPA: carboxypeptidase regulatory-like domain-containing protein [Pyrinomonadaceae bacterium]|nr:carboxypeptidase regulatory-like domain-containing protein [Pyrinomonadaceae bacterium]
MRRKHIIFSLAAVALLILSSVVASAQTGQLFGEVTLKQADGKVVPVAGAAIDVYRTDISNKYNTKTDKNGRFIFAGLPFVGKYVIAVSAPGAQPKAIANVLAGHDVNYKIELDPGDGKQLTEAEAKAFAAGGSSNSGGSKTSSEDQKKLEEAQRKNAEIVAGNKKIEEANATVNRTFKAGNEALNAKPPRYDEAIALYDEGINADPTHPGAPALLTNKSVALRARGVDRFNAAVKLTDDAAKISGMEAAKKDFKDAVDAATKALELIKSETAPTDPAALKNYESSKYFALLARAEAMRLYVPKVDPTQVDAGLTAFQEYLAAETDSTKKATAELNIAKMLFDAQAYDKAVPAYQKVLESSPDNIEAMYGLGLTLVNVGYSESNKEKLQQGVNYLQTFADKAPATDARKAEVKGIVDELKKSQNVTPQKTTPTGRRRGQ